MHRIVVPVSAQKQLATAPEKIRARITEKLCALEQEPFQGNKLVGQLKGIYSVRVPPFRILYEIRKRELVVLVLKIGDRKDVYR